MNNAANVRSTLYAMPVLESLCQGKQTTMWSVNHALPGRSLTQSPTRTPVGLIQTVMGGLLSKQATLPQTQCVNRGPAHSLRPQQVSLRTQLQVQG